jgi:heptosyltransferase-2
VTQIKKVKSVTKILIVGPSWVGDMVMAQSLFMVLKQQNPACQIDVLAPAWSLPLLQRMPEVSGAIAMPVGHGSLQLAVRWKLGRQLSKVGYDQAILLPNSLKSALVPWFARIPRRTGWKGESRYVLLNDLRKLDKEKYPLMVERFVALAVDSAAELPACPNPTLTIEKSAIETLLIKFTLDVDRPVLVLCPGAEFGPSKRWPEKHYAAVAARMIDDGWQVWLMGSAKDQPVAEDICARLTESQRQHSAILAGNTALSEAVDLMSLASAVVSNDSGLMHIAAALGRPLVSVYGSTSPKFTPPLAEQVEIVSIPVDCGPCFQRECPLGHMKCLNDLRPQRVIDALQRVVE